MPTTLTTKEIRTISDYMSFVETQGKELWYRGCDDASHKLVPSLYRHPTLMDTDKLLSQEMEILKRFRQRSIPYLDSPLGEDNLSVLFLMQHYGVPTRLLDWTENPYIALYFALTTSKKDDNGAFIADAAIWVLEPAKWNSKAINFDPPVGVITPPDDELLNGYLPAKSTTHRAPEPVALYGAHNSPRIVAQRGAFCLFGSSLRPMEVAYVDKGYPQDCLIKLFIKAHDIEGLISGLLRIGVNVRVKTSH